ncbi:embryonic polyadenylate-binding protein 2 isoform X4 [Felis catus]|uniref:RRM domain-containing protein n=1 Tax=Felis catus TaxID=9685 RepID=A0ABI7WMD0_FELCA|nr:embryonic polyadenylate-binding protein 2 isoform X4 [Felis catus]
MWPFLSHALFPPPTRAWLQRASSDPEAQGWGAWGRAEKPPLEPGSGDRKEGEPGEAEKDPEDAGFPLSLLEREELAEYPEADQELEAIKVKLWAMEQAQGPEPPGAQGQAGREEGAGATPAGQLLSPEAGCTCPGPPTEQLESDHRSVYVGNVDYGGTAEELEAYFNSCGEVHRVTILCDKFSGHPKGYAYIEFAAESSAQAAVALDKSIFRGRVIKITCVGPRSKEPHTDPVWRQRRGWSVVLYKLRTPGIAGGHQELEARARPSLRTSGRNRP